MDQKANILSTIDAMTAAFHQGDLDGILRTYESGAVVVGQPGTPVSAMEGPKDYERSVLTEEVKLGCTLGMLQCLDRAHRARLRARQSLAE